LVRAALPEGHFVAPLKVVTENTPSLVGFVHSVRQPLWRVLSRLGLGFEVVDGWWCMPSIRSAIDRTVSDLKMRNSPVGVTDLRAHEIWRDASWAEGWIRHCGLITVEGHALQGANNIAGRAAAVLNNAGTSLQIEELVGRLGSKCSSRSARDVLATDERFTRVDRDSWSLSSWGLERYGSIREQIANGLERAGGSARLSRLVRDISDKFSVSSKSIELYAASFPFVTVDGMVEFDLAPRQSPRKDPHLTRRLFRHPEGWALRLMINGEHLRGSSFRLPIALSAVLGLSPGTELTLPSRLGEQRFAWHGSQLSSASIRRFAKADGLEVGQSCFLLVHDSGSVDLMRIELPREPGRARANALSGLSLLQADATLEELGVCVGLPQDSGPIVIRDRLLERGDYDIADCVDTTAWHQ
jgi:hypothetical protein